MPTGSNNGGGTSPPPPNDPFAPPPPPPTPKALGNKPLVKAGIHKPARVFLAAQQNYQSLGSDRLFDCGGSQNLVLNKYSGELPTAAGPIEVVTFHESADQLIELNNLYVLLCKLSYHFDGQFLETEEWEPEQLNGTAYDDRTGKFSSPRSPGTNILNSINWRYSSIITPSPPIAPMPAPAMNTDITELFVDGGSLVTGYVRFTLNPDNTLNFKSEVQWVATGQGQLRFYFPVPQLAKGKSFLPSAFVVEQVITASVAPKVGDTSQSILTTSAWTSGNGTFYFVFEKNNIP